MRRLLFVIALFFLLGTSGVFADTGATSEVSQSAEKRRAIEDVNTLIIDSYRVQLDRILKELYENIRVASKGDVQAQIRILDRVRDDLDARLDSISTSDVSANRKKILMGVYFYLKSRIEAKIEELEKN